MVLFVNLSITASMTLGIYLAANLLPYRWPFLLLMAWSIAMYALSSLAFWGAASRLFDVRQGKRLFSLVSAGDVVAAALRKRA